MGHSPASKATPDEVLESALVANIHRQDLDHLDEAKALDQLLKVHGTQEALAARLHRSQGWVSQRLALLTPTPELKQRLQSGDESGALLRRVGKKKAEEQENHTGSRRQEGPGRAACRKQSQAADPDSARREPSEQRAVRATSEPRAVSRLLRRNTWVRVRRDSRERSTEAARGNQHRGPVANP
ncbi:hypothetical protein [Streptomyces sp. NBC_01230]|uniref:ParB/RepB/Spo0J family partition protein n=1 Tax=Streptomyces sp. NBC_01230 TaxID=2903784 RepID=UPI002F918295